MQQLVPITRDRHAARRWRRHDGYGFARTRSVVPLVGAELGKATLAFPIALLAKDGLMVPVALLSLDPGRNLFVQPDGRWLGSYVPAALRAHPFGLLNGTGGEMVLCIDEGAGLLSDGAEGEPFFDANGAVSERTRQVLEFLRSLEQSRGIARQACAALAEAEVIVPWDATPMDCGEEERMEGLYRVDEAALNALSPERFEGLRKAGAVALAYCQILSMQNLPALGRLAEAQAARQAEEEALVRNVCVPAQTDNVDIDWAVFAAEPGGRRPN